MNGITLHEASTALSAGIYNVPLRFLLQQEERRLIEAEAPPVLAKRPIHRTAEELIRAGEIDYTRKVFGWLRTHLEGRGDTEGLGDLAILLRDYEELAALITGQACQCAHHREERDVADLAAMRRDATDALARSSQTGHDDEDESGALTRLDLELSRTA